MKADNAIHSPRGGNRGMRFSLVRTFHAAVAGSLLLVYCFALRGRGADEALPPEPSAPEERTTVAVLPFRNETGDADQHHWQFGLAGLLRMTLYEMKSLNVLSRTDVECAMRAEGWKDGEAHTGEQARRIGERLEARRVLWGGYRRRGEGWEVQLRALSVPGGVSVSEVTLGGSDWLKLHQAVFAAVLTNLQGAPLQAEQSAIAQVWPSSASALEWLARAMALDVEHQPASQRESCLRRAVAEDPRSFTVQMDLVYTLFELDKNAEAEKTVREVLQSKPQTHHAWCALGFLRSMAGDTNEARAAFEKALRAEPECPSPLEYFAFDRAGEKSFDEAIGLLNRARRISPRSGRLAADLARVHAMRKDEAQALKLAEEAERFACNQPEVEGSLILTYGILHELDRLIPCYRSFLRLAREQNWETNRIEKAEEMLPDFSVLPSKVVRAARPKAYSTLELRRELESRLTREELALVVDPLEVTEEMKTWARELACGLKSPVARALFLFEGMANRVTVKGKGGRRTAREVFKAWGDPKEGFSCQEYAKLYVPLARAVGLEAWYVHLEKDAYGRYVNHDCCVVFFDEQAVLVDPTWRVFGVQHQEFVVLDDLQAIAHHAGQVTGPEGRTAKEREIARCRLGLKLHPELEWAKCQVIYSLINAERLEEAAGELKRSFPDESGSPARLLTESLLEARKQAYPAAVALLFKVLERDQNHFQAHLLLARCLGAMEKLPEARIHYERVLELDDGTNWPDEVAEAKAAMAQIEEVTGSLSGNTSSLALVRRKAEAGELDAQHNLGVILLKAPKPQIEEAIRWFMKAAEQGHTLSQFTLGEFYRTGPEPNRDFGQALKWYRRAADQGHAEACYFIAVMYDRGQANHADATESLRWVRKSAELGYVPAQYDLAEAHYAGKGIPMDYVEAYRWFSRALAGGKNDAKYRLGELELFMTREQLGKAREKPSESQGGEIKPSPPSGK